MHTGYSQHKDVHKQTEVTQWTTSMDKSFSVCSLGGTEDKQCTQDINMGMLHV